MNIKEMRKKLGDTQSEFAMRYGIPFRTVQNWETDKRNPPKYVIDLLEERIKKDLINRKTYKLPDYDPNKIDLPNRSDFVGAKKWLNEVIKILGNNCVLALDSALMCEGRFLGRNNEDIIWVYGDDSLRKYNGVIILGNYINPHDVDEENNIKYTSFNRTLNDSLSNEEILDMQGITEALSKYYYSNNESFNSLYIIPEYQDSFKKLAVDAIEYYND